MSFKVGSDRVCDQCKKLRSTGNHSLCSKKRQLMRSGAKPTTANISAQRKESVVRSLTRHD